MSLRKNEGLLTVGVLLLMAVPGLLIKDGFYQNIYILTILFAALSSSWNIVGGFAGQLSLGHAAFFGIGAYTVALLYLRQGISPWFGLIVAVAIAVAVSVIISYPSFKLRGAYYAMCTLAFGEVIRILAIYFRGLTNGSGGLSIPFKPSFQTLIFENKTFYIFFVLFYLAIVQFIVLWIKHSRIGYYLRAIKENEEAAPALGINTRIYKLYASILSAGLTVVGGMFYCLYILYIEPYSVFDVVLSIQFIIVSIIGGIGTLWGPVLGSFLITPLNEFLRAWFGGNFKGLHLVIYGFLMIVMVILLPGGLVEGISRAAARLFKSRFSSRPRKREQEVNKRVA